MELMKSRSVGRNQSAISASEIGDGAKRFSGSFAVGVDCFGSGSVVSGVVLNNGSGERLRLKVASGS